jgi:hypothetical protein
MIEGDTGTQKNYLKGVTKVDNLSWIYNLASPMLLQTSKPIIEDIPNSGMDYKIARAQSKGQGLISYDKDTDEIQVYVRVFYGP